jgi:hypothetical protein
VEEDLVSSSWQGSVADDPLATLAAAVLGLARAANEYEIQVAVKAVKG